MSNTTTDNFESIAQNAVAALIAAALTLQMLGLPELADKLATKAEDFCNRAIALGGK